ncbi:hypothetical protein DXB23_10890 [Dorea sp. OM02-2LB]|nr:hypothetical protein DXB23_10890 [Dorea sp. OM02-2LB]RGV95734.1 hypothetical protein DWV97_10815 [Ruminococcus sp. AF14-10]
MKQVLLFHSNHYSKFVSLNKEHFANFLFVQKFLRNCLFMQGQNWYHKERKRNRSGRREGK